ncbi:aBC-type multidrug transport system ATPase and permease components [Clostridium sp. CAG:594]|nr:aBC-type multidrug transport system ATPase and permease components [Clostridium sp. CAG:594]
MMYPFKVLNKKKYALCFINAFLENICLYIMPVILSIFLTVPFSLEKFKWLIILTIAIKILEIFFNILWNTKVEPFLEVSKKDLQIAYFKRLCNMNVSRINNTHTGYLKKQLDIISEETVALLDEIMMTVNGFCVAITIFLIQVWTQSYIMFIVCLIFTIIIVVYNVIITKSNVKIQEEYNDTNAKYNATAVDFLQNVKIVKNFDALNYATATMNKKFDVVKNPLKKSHIFHSMRSDGINGLVYLMYAIILISLFFRMKNGDDVFSYIVFYSSMFSGLNVELKGVASLFIHYNKFKSANNQIEKMIIEEEPQNKTRNWNNITLKDIEFKYNDESNTIIKIPSFSLNKKDKISIVGESGQGKSTFLSLFCRFYDIDDKNYLKDGTPTSKIPDIAYISQESDLFDLTIKENLCLGKRISNETLNEYLKDAGLDEWINDLENGLDTLVGEKGIKLSAGQKQRLNIIRGILLDKEIYILDEPTSNLDSLSENKIYDMINKYLKNKTCLIVTHRPKLTEICNKHYYFDKRVMLEK